MQYYLEVSQMGVKDSMTTFFVKQIADYLAKDPEQNADRMFNIARKLTKNPQHLEQIGQVQEAITKDGNWKEYYHRIMRELDPKVRNTFIINYFVKSCLIGVPMQHENAAKIGASVPWAILIDPTDRCNLRCTGCWAGEYEKKNDLSDELLDRVVGEARDLGIYAIVLSGGEPMTRQNTIFKLARKYDDMVFLAFTNATLITEETVKNMKDCANFTVAISLEGLKESTDQRRGEGTYDKVMHAMDLLREGGIPFGVSTCYTRYNVEEVGSDEYVQTLIDKGAYFNWYFTYVPVGKDADISMMATPEQREYMFHRVDELRRTKDLFLIDFWNDGIYSGGCIAGGRRYLHINAAGEVEPCAFIHYAVDNIKEKSLKECLTSDLMKAYQKRQPFNENLLLPCPLIDNPHKLVEIVEESNAHFTQSNEDGLYEIAKNLKPYSEEWGKRADKLLEKKAEETAATKA